jgi:hypothetical protein
MLFGSEAIRHGAAILGFVTRVSQPTEAFAREMEGEIELCSD